MRRADSSVLRTHGRIREEAEIALDSRAPASGLLRTQLAGHFLGNDRSATAQQQSTEVEKHDTTRHPPTRAVDRGPWLCNTSDALYDCSHKILNPSTSTS